MHFICRSFIGKSNPQNWSQYWENEPDDFQLKTQKGHLFGLINLSSDQNINIVAAGINIIDQLNKNYFENDSPDIISGLQQAINKIDQNENYKINLVLIIILNEKIYTVSLGQNKVALKRGSQISLLIKDEDKIDSISGPVQSEDRIIFMTKSFFDQFNWEKIKSIISNQNIQNIEEDILSVLYSIENQENLAAALIEIKADQIKDNSIDIKENFPNESVNNPPQSVAEPVKPVFVENQQPRQLGKRKKVQILIAILLLIGLFVSSYFGYQKNKKINTENKYQQLKTELESQLNNITLVKSMNLEAAQTGAKESEKIVDQMVKLNIHQDEVDQYKSQINLLLSQTGVNENFIPDIFFDTSLITSQPQYKDIFINSSKIYLLDSANGRIDSLNIAEKSSKSILISDNIKSSAKVFGDNNYLYLLYSDRISKIDDSSISSQITFSDLEENISITDVQIWNGSIYLLDNDNRSIWKFSPSSSGFSSPQTWLKNNQELSIGSISITIDGEIWVLYQNGLLENYISGVKDNFNLSGDNQFTQTKNISVSQDDDGFITFVDNKNIIFVYQKSGDFVAKYNLGNLEIIDIAINDNVIYLLTSDQKIYKISL